MSQLTGEQFHQQMQSSIVQKLSEYQILISIKKKNTESLSGENIGIKHQLLILLFIILQMHACILYLDKKKMRIIKNSIIFFIVFIANTNVWLHLSNAKLLFKF